MRSRLLMAFVALPGVLLLPACGGSGVTVPSPAPLSISVSPTQATVKAGSEFAFRASVVGSKNTAVAWQVNGVTGGNATTGTVDSKGLYTAPSLPPSPPLVTVAAVAQADGTKSASASVTVTINITVVPAIASLFVSTQQCPISQQFTALVSGTSNPAVSWSINGLPAGSSNPAYGSLSADGIYTSPNTIPSPANLTIAATSDADPTESAVATVNVSAGGPSVDQIAQRAPIYLGTSGGNSGDKTSNFCCSGTLGALVSRNGEEFILSNNHVLARTDQATPGEAITQPGLVDNACAAGNVIATFTQATQLQNANQSAIADAALAKVVSGEVNSSGAILQLGSVSCGRAQPAPPAGTAIAASVGMLVAKSGRTTGLTCGTITAVSVDNVKVDYPASCGSSTTLTVTFNNQIIVDSPTFSDSGDSGSLIVDAGTAEPTALLFAGDASSGITVANPIQDALAALPDPSNQAVPTIVGGDPHPVEACTGSPAPGGMGQSAPQAGMAATRIAGTIAETEIAHARGAKSALLGTLANDPAVLGIGIGAGDNPGEAAIVVFVKRGKAHQAIPAAVEGIPTRVRAAGPLRAFSDGNCSAADRTRSNLTLR